MYENLVQPVIPTIGQGLKGYLAHRKPPPPPRTNVGPWK